MGGLRVHHSRGSETWGTSWFKVNVLRRPAQGCAADLSLGNGLGADVHRARRPSIEWSIGPFVGRAEKNLNSCDHKKMKIDGTVRCEWKLTRDEMHWDKRLGIKFRVANVDDIEFVGWAVIDLPDGK